LPTAAVTRSGALGQLPALLREEKDNVNVKDRREISFRRDGKDKSIKRRKKKK
jgi:hypothetical protein